MTKRCWSCGRFISYAEAIDYHTCSRCMAKELIEACGAAMPYGDYKEKRRLTKVARAARAGKLDRGWMAELWHDIILGVF